MFNLLSKIFKKTNNDDEDIIKWINLHNQEIDRINATKRTKVDKLVPITPCVYVRMNKNVVKLCGVRTTYDLYEFARERFFECCLTEDLPNAQYTYEHCKFTFYYKNKPLSRNKIPLSNYNIKNKSYIDFVPTALLGGMEQIEQDHTLSYNVVLEREVMNRPIESISDWCDVPFELQSLEGMNIMQSDSDYEGPFRTAFEFNDYMVNKCIEYIEKNKKVLGWLIDYERFEDNVDKFFHCYSWYQRCHNIDDFVQLSLLAYKFMTGRFLHRDAIKAMMGRFFTDDDLQGDSASDLLQILRSGFNNINSYANCELVKKVTAMYSYLLVHGFLTKFGIKISNEEYTTLERKALSAKYSSKKEMWLCILDTSLFICEKIYEFKMTGDVNVFIHSSDAYSKWYKEADRILALAPFTSNLGAHGTTYFAYVSDLNNAIEKGEAYNKFTLSTSGIDCQAIKKKLFALQLIKNTDITRRASQKERKSPFGVLVHGRSSVAKSSFTKLLYYYYASLHGLGKEDHYRYVRNPADEYWSNFDSSKWCIQMDDIAFLHPNKSSEVDPTLKEMLNVVNNVPYVPPQAALEDKGKTPVLAELVIATTNAIDLNAHAYFWCPLAVQRRLPFIVTIEPKDEYKHDNQVFIDPTKLLIETGLFPNYWNIKLHKIAPCFDGQRDRATLELVEEYDDIDKFLQKFGEMSLEHQKNQNKASNSDENMREITVCAMCLKNSRICDCKLQSFSDDAFLSEEEFKNEDFETYRDEILQREREIDTSIVKSNIEPTTFISDVIGFFMYYIQCFFTFVIMTKYFVSFQMYCAKFRVLRKLIIRYILPAYPTSFQCKMLGGFNSQLTFNSKWKKFLLGFSASMSLFTILYGMYQYYYKYYKIDDIKVDNTQNKQEDEPQEEEVKVEDQFVFQGNMYNTVEDQLEKETRQNVWYNETVELSKFDIPVASQSLVGVDDTQIQKTFENNCVAIDIQGHGEKAFKTMKVGGVFIRGHYCIVNNHAFKPGCTHYTVNIISGIKGKGLNVNLKVTIKNSSIIRNYKKDYCLFEVTSLPLSKDISKFWLNGRVDTSKLLMLKRTQEGAMTSSTVFNAQRSEKFPVEVLNQEMSIMLGTSERVTMNGDCGSIAIAKTPIGPCIIGIHMLGYERQCGITLITLDDLESSIKDLQKLYPTLEVVGGGEPNLSLQSKENVLTTLHHRSLPRYIEKGSVKIYGSLAGFRPRPRSRVSNTPLTEEFLEYFQIEQNYGRPQMDGWMPWKKNVEQMVQPYVNYDKDVLEHCVQSFTKDILSELPTGWEKDLIYLSDMASVNGLPGVIYIDKINSNSSMGFPWNETKKKHLIPAPCETYPEGVTFGDEVWERVNAIKAKYKNGQRAFPVFTGHLKDEATALEKCKIGKTRLFTGAPIDWSLVVRSRLLTFVRLLQKNKFVFEAGPGTVCQSSEWGRIRKYLTTFGEDRLVAGDYGKFDKRMISDFVLAAFKIITNIYLAAGYSKDEAREIMCIAEDTAFPLVNVSGDLMEFYGTNPSGHPLTVIINSLVNSLYMRYCYTTLNPKKECSSFKKNVHLFTYGDDNILGVSKNAEWFNHTAIQARLALIGVEYTMADKESESVPFIHINDCQFLKRIWRFDEDVGDWLCPLEESSIIKSLTKWLPSKTIDEHAQMVAVISSANAEYFFYGREIFEIHHKKFRSILDREPYCFYETSGTLPGWHELKARFDAASKTVQ